MEIIETETRKELAQKAAQIISETVIKKPNCVLGLATGSTPLETYAELSEMNKAGKLDFSKVQTVNLDEYVGLSAEHEQSYAYFMDKNLFSKINIKKENTNIPNGMAQDLAKECERYDKLIDNLGGIDLQLLGIGNNGHIGFNEPDNEFTKNTHEVNLTDSTIKANSRFFEKESDVPKAALTMGIDSIMKAKKILLIAYGKEKFEILSKAIKGEVTPKIPASIIKLHSDVTVIYCKK